MYLKKEKKIVENLFKAQVYCFSFFKKKIKIKEHKKLACFVTLPRENIIYKGSFLIPC